MKIKILVSFLAIIFCWQITSCNKNSNKCKWAAEPPVFLFQIKKNGSALNNSVLTGTKLSYINNGNKKYVSDLSVATDSSGILGSRQIGTFEKQTFFIEYPNNSDIDTLEVQNSMPSLSTNCQYKIVQVRFNNNMVTSDITIINRPLYIFLKQ